MSPSIWIYTLSQLLFWANDLNNIWTIVVKILVNKSCKITMLQVLDWLVLLRNCDVQILWTLQGVEWFDVVHVVPRFADPRVQSNNKNSSNLTKLNNKNKLSVYFNPGHNLYNKRYQVDGVWYPTGKIKWESCPIYILVLAPQFSLIFW